MPGTAPVCPCYRRSPSPFTVTDFTDNKLRDIADDTLTPLYVDISDIWPSDGASSEPSDNADGVYDKHPV